MTSNIRKTRGRPRAVRVEVLPVPPEFRWTVTEIASAHRMTPAGVRAVIARGELEAELLGREFRVRDSAYRRWCAASAVGAFFPKNGGLAND